MEPYHAGGDSGGRTGEDHRLAQYTKLITQHPLVQDKGFAKVALAMVLQKSRSEE